MFNKSCDLKEPHNEASRVVCVFFASLSDSFAQRVLRNRLHIATAKALSIKYWLTWFAMRNHNQIPVVNAKALLAVLVLFHID